MGRTSGRTDCELCLPGLKPLKWRIIRRMALPLQLNAGDRKRLDIRPEATGRKIRLERLLRYQLACFVTHIAEGPVIDAPVNQFILPRRTPSSANELVRHGGETKMKHAIIRSGNRPSQVDLTRPSRQNRRRKAIRLFEEVLSIQNRQLLPILLRWSRSGTETCLPSLL